ncbi:polymerase 14 [Seminavis robusta]|uniref:Poly [ADP-ribose] polymerase n=1 Tax=Seminavis robusta TaxID=568900 RepID=A0A9N8HP68_9STRA|nr:polymerase 14 [Seminavis robusta]|eukprot:Sro1042_g234720.1 polymerase 14 (1264) ;mRNA; f:32878-36755
MLGWAHASGSLLEPARLSCNAAYSAPCSRTNSEWLAKSITQDFAEKSRNNETTLEALFQEITDQNHNMRVGFYPFVFHMENATCAAHGAVPEYVGKTLLGVFSYVGISFSDPVALMERFVAAAKNGGGWVRYIWSNGAQGHAKLAFVTLLTDEYFLGVGYENTPLPIDVPCSASFDSWCSIANVRSLLGKAQTQISLAESLPQFEAAVYELTFNKDYQIPGGFYVYMYGYDGCLKSHAILNDYLGSTFADVIVDKKLGTAEEAWELHNQFVTAAEGANTGWVRYLWKNADDKVFTKVAFVIKIDFRGKWYYLGCGFDFNSQASANPMTMAPSSGPMLPMPVSEPMTSSVQSMVESSAQSMMDSSGTAMGLSVPMFPAKPCSQSYNLPCSFRTALQLSSHALVHVISSPTSEEETWRAITEDPRFRSNDFYVFVSEFDTAICRAHGLVPGYVGMTTSEIFVQNNIPVDGNAVHNNFQKAAENGNGWVLYDWIVPGVKDSIFQKVSYVFQINLHGKRYYGGVGFNHHRAPLQEFKESGTTMNGDRILCTREYGMACSDTNVLALIGQASAELTLAGSDARVTHDREQQISRVVDDILKAINDKDPAFSVNDFYLSVFHFNSFICEDDGSGCCVAHGADRSMVGKTWQQILRKDSITSITGQHLHERLIQSCSSDYGFFDYLYSETTGEARTKRAVVASFQDVMDEDLYVVAEYFLTPPPPTCDNCPNHMECTERSQSFCKIKRKDTSHSPIPWIVALSVLIVSSALGFYYYKRRNWRKRQILAKRIKQMEEQMKGMVEIVLDTGTQLTSAQDYKDKFGLVGVGKAPSTTTKQVKIVWCWKENTAFLPRHNPSSIIPGTSFVKYQESISAQIEEAYNFWKDGRGYKEVRVDLTDKVRKIQNQASGANYVLDFEEMTQRNLWSEHVREIRRQEHVVEALQSGVVDHLPRLPRSIDFFGADGEDFLPTFKGQVIQVSKEHCDRQWLYGSVLYDPLLVDAQSKPHGNLATEGLNRILSVALHDRPTSGWFPSAVSRPADVNVMKNLLHSLGGDGVSNLKAPATWDANKEGLVLVAKNTEEYRAVEANFLAALYDQVEFVTVVGIERIQCMPLWQSYAVKKETMKLRDAKSPENRDNNQDPSVERKWLFHGTTTAVIPKIVKQGFNRAFAGRNAVAFGKGVYFARDASYSSHRAYSTPDWDGTQHIFMCRVAVGDWCQGTNGQLTPDPKPRNPLELFDSTVDNVLDPSIFVVYHDAQAYPDYLVSFQRSD